MAERKRIDVTDQGVPVERLNELTGGKGVDVAIDFVCANGTQEAALKALAKGGRYVMLAGSSKPFTADPAKVSKLKPAFQRLVHALDTKAVEFTQVVKAGRTHLMDATPVTLSPLPPGAEGVAARQQLKRIRS